MANNELDHLIKMANQIAANMAFSGSEEQQISDVAGHLQRFWAPSMKQRLQDYARTDGAALAPVALKALKSLDEN